MFRNWSGRTHEEIAQAREDRMNGTRFGEVKGYDGPPQPVPEVPANDADTRPKAHRTMK
jgi:hypothetical protein